MPHQPSESLDKFRERVEALEAPRFTSPIFWKVGWPLLGVGILLWLVLLTWPGVQFLLSIVAIVLVSGGGLSVALSIFSSHSEGVEVSERRRRIRERTAVARCLYLEGNVPEGKGSVGRCRLYEFDMVDLPYCLYCKEYKASKGPPEV